MSNWDTHKMSKGFTVDLDMSIGLRGGILASTMSMQCRYKRSFAFCLQCTVRDLLTNWSPEFNKRDLFESPISK